MRIKNTFKTGILELPSEQQTIQLTSAKKFWIKYASKKKRILQNDDIFYRQLEQIHNQN